MWSICVTWGYPLGLMPFRGWKYWVGCPEAGSAISIRNCCPSAVGCWLDPGPWLPWPSGKVSWLVLIKVYHHLSWNSSPLELVLVRWCGCGKFSYLKWQIVNWINLICFLFNIINFRQVFTGRFDFSGQIVNWPSNRWIWRSRIEFDDSLSTQINWRKVKHNFNLRT